MTAIELQLTYKRAREQGEQLAQCPFPAGMMCITVLRWTSKWCIPDMQECDHTAAISSRLFLIGDWTMAEVHRGTSDRSKNSAANGVAMRVTSKLRQKRTGNSSVPGHMCKASNKSP